MTFPNVTQFGNVQCRCQSSTVGFLGDHSCPSTTALSAMNGPSFHSSYFPHLWSTFSLILSFLKTMPYFTAKMTNTKKYIQRLPKTIAYLDRLDLSFNATPAAKSCTCSPYPWSGFSIKPCHVWLDRGVLCGCISSPLRKAPFPGALLVT